MAVSDRLYFGCINRNWLRKWMERYFKKDFGFIEEDCEKLKGKDYE